MRKSNTQRIFASIQWITAALVLSVFLSSCSQKMAFVNTVHSQPAFVQTMAPHSTFKAAMLENKAATPKTALKQVSAPTPLAATGAAAEKAIKYTHHKFFEKTVKSISIVNPLKNVHVKTHALAIQKGTEHGAIELVPYLKLAIGFAILGLIFELISSLSYSSLAIFVTLGGICLLLAIVFLVLWFLQF